MKSYSDVAQDLFAVTMLGYKQAGTFVDIGCNAPTHSNNTYLLEKDYGFRGLCIDLVSFVDFAPNRPKSRYVIADALTLDYTQLFEECGFSKQIDYLSIDIDPGEQSLAVLKMLPTEYRFSVITFEFERPGSIIETESRQYLKSLGYYLAKQDVGLPGGTPFEDFYIDPNIVSIEQLKNLKEV